MTTTEYIIKNIGNWPRAKGKALYVKYLKGEKLTRDEAITAKCYECVCGEDASPCNVLACPLQPYCPFNRN